MAYVVLRRKAKKPTKSLAGYTCKVKYSSTKHGLQIWDYLGLYYPSRQHVGFGSQMKYEEPLCGRLVIRHFHPVVDATNLWRTHRLETYSVLSKSKI